MPKKQSKSILGKIGSFLDEMAAAAAKAEADFRESAGPIEGMVQEHNKKFPSRPLYLTTTKPNSVRECGPYTVLSDCQDHNCSRHYFDKQRAGR